MEDRLVSNIYQRVFQYIKHATTVEPPPTKKSKDPNLGTVSFKAGKKAVPPDECLQSIIE